MKENNELIYSSQVKKNVREVLLFLTDKKKGSGLTQVMLANKFDIGKSLINEFIKDKKDITRDKFINIVSYLINNYNINPDFIYHKKGSIIKGMEENIVSEPTSTYGNNKEVECLKKDIQLLELENKHLKEAAYLKDEFIAQLKENKAYLESQLAKSGIKSGI